MWLYMSLVFVVPLAGLKRPALLIASVYSSLNSNPICLSNTSSSVDLP